MRSVCVNPDSSQLRRWRRLAFRAYRSTMGLAVESLLRGKVTMGAKLLMAPVGYWRFWPFGIVLDELGEGKQDILDVSSPKALSLYLGSEGARVVATDLDDPNLHGRWVKYAEMRRWENYRVCFADARRMNFEDESFDFIYSISVIEHIPGDGDTEALREFARLLRPGGKAVVEVPYRREREQVFLDYDSKGAALGEKQFYERHYDWKLLNERLRIPELEVTAKWVLGEYLRLDPWIATTRLPRPVRHAFLPLEPFLAAVNYWVRGDDREGHPLAALLVYRKPL